MYDLIPWHPTVSVSTISFISRIKLHIYQHSKMIVRHGGLLAILMQVHKFLFFSLLNTSIIFTVNVSYCLHIAHKKYVDLMQLRHSIKWSFWPQNRSALCALVKWSELVQLKVNFYCAYFFGGIEILIKNNGLRCVE